MRLKSIGVMSLGKVLGILYGGLGFIFGGIFSIISLFAAAAGGNSEMFFGVAAVIIAPFLYGFMGFIGGLITAWLYNLIAGWTGGIEMEFEKNPQAPTYTKPPIQ